MSLPYLSTLVIEVETSVPKYSLEEVAGLAGLQPDLLRYYCRIGLFDGSRTQPEADHSFDDNDLYELLRFKHFRDTHGVKTKTLRVVLALWRDIDLLRREIHFLRS